jgi:superfamily II RNA helicase
MESGGLTPYFAVLSVLIMLSATIDPAERFAKWIEKVKEREVWWTPTPKRIVPLIHYSYLI